MCYCCNMYDRFVRGAVAAAIAFAISLPILVKVYGYRRVGRLAAFAMLLFAGMEGLVYYLTLYHTATVLKDGFYGVLGAAAAAGLRPVIWLLMLLVPYEVAKHTCIFCYAYMGPQGYIYPGGFYAYTLIALYSLLLSPLYRDTVEYGMVVMLGFHMSATMREGYLSAIRGITCGYLHPKFWVGYLLVPALLLYTDGAKRRRYAKAFAVTLPAIALIDIIVYLFDKHPPIPGWFYTIAVRYAPAFTFYTSIIATRAFIDE